MSNINIKKKTQRMGGESMITFFLHLQNTIKVYHWQTTSYARHKATDELLERIANLIDRFVETFIGRYGQRPSFPSGITLQLEQMSDNRAEEMLKSYVQVLKYELPKQLKPSDSDLLNIRDEIVGHIHQTLYLFTLV
jgi:hypothetical protein